MSSLAFNFTTDHHFSYKPPGRRQGDYFIDLSVKMHQVVSHCNRTGAIPLFGGDLFHLKDPAKTATLTMLKFLGDMSDMLREFKSPPLCAIGNHDIRYDRLSTLPEQPLGVLASSGVIDLLCNYDLSNLSSWEAPSGHTYLVENTLSGNCFPVSETTAVFVYSTPYMEDPRDLVAYLGSLIFHQAMGNLVAKYATGTSRAYTGILLLHTLANISGGEFYGLQRASYNDIHGALAYSALGRATSAVLFGHEHPEGPDCAIPLDTTTPLSLNNLPSGGKIATTGTVYLNPASFSRSSLDYKEDLEDPERPVYMLDLLYTPAGNGLSLTPTKVFLETRPITQLFGVSNVDPLNQDSGVVPEVSVVEQPVWTSFTEALKNLDTTEVNPAVYLMQRLQEEPSHVASAVNTLITP